MTDKTDLRARVAASRAARPEAQRAEDRADLRAHVLAQVATTVRTGATIACYESLRTEPGSIELLAALSAAGFQVIVPVTLPDRDLDWVRWQPTPAKTDLLGRAAIGAAELVLVPAFAVDRSGNRLGRGGGSYDRALARVAPEVPVAALLYRDELLATVPVDVWDRPVTAAVTPDGWLEFTPTGRRNSP